MNWLWRSSRRHKPSYLDKLQSLVLQTKACRSSSDASPPFEEKTHEGSTNMEYSNTFAQASTWKLITLKADPSHENAEKRSSKIQKHVKLYIMNTNIKYYTYDWNNMRIQVSASRTELDGATRWKKKRWNSWTQEYENYDGKKSSTMEDGNIFCKMSQAFTTEQSEFCRMMPRVVIIFMPRSAYYQEFWLIY